MDYEAIGLKCGLEIHQQVDTHKLFCSCPSTVRDDPPDIIVKRVLRASAGETGEIDVAAAHEAAKQKYFLYQAYSDTTCLVELDCEPPHNINSEALNVALQVALMLKARAVDAVQVMRKTVVDGSNTSGFQRTALIARNGLLEISSRKIRVSTVCLEEEAAKIVERTAGYDTYNISRLGIPLIEVGTEPDIRSPEEAKEAAQYVGMILRSTGKVKRGLGTIRQDLNVSIREGARVEVKGAQDLRQIAKLVENEALRQKSLVDIRNELSKKNAGVDEKVCDLTSLLKGSESKIIRSAEKVLAIRLANFKGFLGKEIQPGRRLGTEFSDYAKVIGGVGGIIHSDELPAYGITSEETAGISAKLGCLEKDAFVLVADSEEKAKRAIAAVIQRAIAALERVPKEVRKANQDATTSFLRPMPGASRMYPETDVEIVKVSTKGITIPELRTDISGRLVKLGLGADLANKVAKEGMAELLEDFANRFRNVKAAFIAETLVSYAHDLLKEKLDPLKIKEEHLKQIFAALNDARIAKQAVMELLREVASGKGLNIEKRRLISDSELEAEIAKVVSENKGLPFNALIGKAMERLRGRADGKKIVEMLRKAI